MNYEQWETTYQPQMNHLADPADCREMYETYGVELGYVLATADLDPKRVWTLIDGDGGTFIVNGYHLVNRFAYIITKNPFEGEFLEVLDNAYSEDEE
jgi:hypothetical protein